MKHRPAETHAQAPRQSRPPRARVIVGDCGCDGFGRQRSAASMSPLWPSSLASEPPVSSPAGWFARDLMSVFLPPFLVCADSIKNRIGVKLAFSLIHFSLQRITVTNREK